MAACRCNKSAPVSAPNCAYCCNFSCYNEPIGGQWPSGLKPAKGDNALGDGQLFWYAKNTHSMLLYECSSRVLQRLPGLTHGTHVATSVTSFGPALNSRTAML